MINLLGIHLHLMFGETVPMPASLKVNESLQSVEVTQKDEGRSGFQLVFQVGRGLADMTDFKLLKEAKIKPFNRVVISVQFGNLPLPIFDGIITKHQLAPSETPGQSKLTVTGEDLSLMMDLEKVSRPYPQFAHSLIVLFALANYARYKITPVVIPPADPLMRPVTEGTTTQPTNKTDLAFIKDLASKHGFVFYIDPGDVPLFPKAYWGPPNRLTLPQPALSVNMGPGTNVEQMSFSRNEHPPKAMKYTTGTGSSARSHTISTSTRQPRLARNVPNVRQLDFLSSGPNGESDSAKRVRAQGLVNKSFDEVVTAEGTLDALNYGKILKPRSIVGVRGAGETFDGNFYVKEVKHTIDVKKGEYKQAFKLTREGTGTLTPLVVP